MPNPLTARIERLSIPEPNSGCWLWLGYAPPCPIEPRPLMTVDGKRCRANRVSLEAFKGPIPRGCYACHTCHNSMCVNPDHLYPGTAKQNTQDMMRAGRHFSQANAGALVALKERAAIRNAKRRANPYCPKGHLLSGANLIFNRTTGQRRCRTCRGEWLLSYRKKGNDNA